MLTHELVNKRRDEASTLRMKPQVHKGAASVQRPTLADATQETALTLNPARVKPTILLVKSYLRLEILKPRSTAACPHPVNSKKTASA